jgi:hypothetical protein
MEVPFDIGVVKPLVGLEYGGEYEVNCMSCNHALFMIMKVSDNPTTIQMGIDKVEQVRVMKFTAKCPFCDGKSWGVSIEGSVFVSAIEGETLLCNLETEDPKDGEMLTIVELQKV